jgi:hypothetical protein
MPAVPGKLQSAILDKVNASRPHLPILLNKILWELALDRDGVKWSGEVYKAGNVTIEAGVRNKSFEINFRRAIKQLANDKRILIVEKKLSNLDDMLTNLPYLTDKAEIRILRTELVPLVQDYIKKEQPVILHTNFDPFGFQMRNLKTKNKETYQKLVSHWEVIEKMIINLLRDANSKRFDAWLAVLMWGRCYFRGAKSKYSLKLPATVDTQLERNVISEVTSLSSQVAMHLDFQIGIAKKVLYALFSAPRHGHTVLSENMKRFLFKEKEEFIRALPGDEDDVLFTRKLHTSPEYNLQNRKYSPLLDQLFTRHIFKELSFVDLIH